MRDGYFFWLLLIFAGLVFLSAPKADGNLTFVRYECIPLVPDGLGRPVFDCRVIVREDRE